MTSKPSLYVQDWYHRQLTVPRVCSLWKAVLMVLLNCLYLVPWDLHPSVAAMWAKLMALMLPQFNQFICMCCSCWNNSTYLLGESYEIICQQQKWKRCHMRFRAILKIAHACGLLSCVLLMVLHTIFFVASCLDKKLLTQNIIIKYYTIGFQNR